MAVKILIGVLAFVIWYCIGFFKKDIEHDNELRILTGDKDFHRMMVESYREKLIRC